jgi:hypothetical protein
MGAPKATAGCAAYRFRATLDSRWVGYLTIVALVGLLGGVAMGSLAARRTQSAFPTYLASTNPSNLALETGGWQPGQPNSAGASLAGAQLVSHLPRVTRVVNAYNLNAQPLDADGYPRGAPAGAKSLGLSTLNNYSSLDGEYVDVDRATADAVALPSVPGLVVAAIGLGALALALLVAAIPGRLAADTPTALLLRAE